jgi:hypothetical protein
LVFDIITLSPNGRSVANGGTDKIASLRLYLWEVETGNVINIARAH